MLTIRVAESPVLDFGEDSVHPEKGVLLPPGLNVRRTTDGGERHTCEVRMPSSVRQQRDASSVSRIEICSSRR